MRKERSGVTDYHRKLDCTVRGHLYTFIVGLFSWFGLGPFVPVHGNLQPALTDFSDHLGAAKTNCRHNTEITL